MAKKSTVKKIKNLPSFLQKKQIKKADRSIKKIKVSPKKLFAYKSDNPNFKSCSISYLYVKENLKNAEEVVEKSQKKTKKKTKWNILFFLCNIAVISVLLIVNLSHDAEGLALSIKGIDYHWIFIAFLIGIFANLLESGKYFSLIYVNTKQARPFLSYKVCALGKYYDNITPMAAGGQPFQIYYLNKRGINGEVAANIPLARYIFWQLIFVIINIVVLCFKFTTIFGSSASFNVVFTLAIISLIGNGIIFAFMLFMSLSKKFALRLIIWGLKLLAKMKIVKNYQLQFRKTMVFVRNYQNCFKYMAKQFWFLIIQIVLAIAEITVFASIPYFILKGFLSPAQMANIEFVNVMAQALICQLAVGIIPTPGGAIASELSFLALFSTYLPNVSQATLAMLFYRIITYYFILLQGITVVSYDFAYGNKKNERLLRLGKFKIFKKKK